MHTPGTPDTTAAEPLGTEAGMPSRSRTWACSRWERSSLRVTTGRWEKSGARDGTEGDCEHRRGRTAPDRSTPWTRSAGWDRALGQRRSDLDPEARPALPRRQARRDLAKGLSLTHVRNAIPQARSCRPPPPEIDGPSGVCTRSGAESSDNLAGGAESHDLIGVASCASLVTHTAAWPGVSRQT